VLPWIVRLGGLFALAAGVAAWRIRLDCPTKTSSCPGYALRSPWILHGEHAGIAIVGVLAVLLLFCRVIVEGRLPDTMGRDGVGWTPERAHETVGAIDDLRSAVATLNSERDQMARNLGDALTDLSDRLDEVERKMP
jgi:hypothetical protein